MASEVPSFTAAGNIRAPARREIVQWILAAWDGLDKTMIVNSFKSSTLTVAVDGSEDGHINCFKENQPCRAGLQRLKVVQQAMSNHATRILSTGSQNPTSRMRHQIAN